MGSGHADQICNARVLVLNLLWDSLCGFESLNLTASISPSVKWEQWTLPPRSRNELVNTSKALGIKSTLRNAKSNLGQYVTKLIVQHYQGFYFCFTNAQYKYTQLFIHHCNISMRNVPAVE